MVTLAPDTLDAPAITEPGVYNIPAEVYHADPVAGRSLSSSGARKLLPPSCPAIFRYEQDHPGPTKPVWEIGSAAHKLVLGVGPELAIVDRPRWDTNEAKEQVAAIRARGGIPLKRPDYDMVHAMAAELRKHPWARALFQPGAGRAEQTIVWRDKPTGVMCRALLDWLPDPVAGQRFIFRDYKTSAPTSIARPDRTIDDYGYYVQAAFHLAGLRALGLAGDDAQALIVLQRKEPPHLVRVVQPDPMAMRIGAAKVREALETYAACRAAEARGDINAWPAWSDDVEMVSLPPWTEREYQDLWS
jgi:hypothetical protein